MIQEAYPEWQRSEWERAGRERADSLSLFGAPGANESGYIPTWYNCVIKLDKVPEKTVGSIIIPDSARSMQQSAETHCTLIALGPLAFTGSDGEVIPGAPKPGDRVVIGKYSGAPPKAGDNENLFRFCADKDIIAIQA